MRECFGLRLGLLIGFAAAACGCASHGDLVNLREDVRKDLASTRVHLNERIDQAAEQLEAKRKSILEQTQQSLAEVKAQMQSLAAVQAKVKDLHAIEERQQKSLDDLKHQVSSLAASEARLRDLQQRVDGMQKDRARLQVLIQAVEETLLHSLKAEQVGLRDRLKSLDRSVKNMETGGTGPAQLTTQQGQR